MNFCNLGRNKISQKISVSNRKENRNFTLRKPYNLYAAFVYKKYDIYLIKSRVKMLCISHKSIFSRNFKIVFNVTHDKCISIIFEDQREQR